MGHENVDGRSRARRWAVPVVAVAIGAFGATTFAETAIAQPPGAPGLLSTTDLPAGYQQTGPPQAYTQFNLAVTDAASCTETPKPVADVVTANVVAFVPPGAPPTFTSGLAESVLTFPTAKAAKAAYKAAAANQAVRLKCASVGFIPPSGTAPIATLQYGKVKVPKAGGGAFASTGAYGPTTGSIAVTFVSGPYLVGLGFAGAPYTPTPKDLATIIKNAQKRLTAPA